MSRLLPRGLVALVFCLAGAAHAEALIKPLPNPDLSRLPAGERKSVEVARGQFEQAKPALIGVPLAEAYAKMGALYARFGYNDVALLALDDAVALAPEDGRFHYLHGYLNIQLKRLPNARQDFETAARLDSDYLPIRYRLAEVQIALGDLSAARKTYQTVASKRPELAPAHAGLGEIALREKKYAESIGHFERALKADPRANALNARLAEAVAASGDAARAATLRTQAGDVAAGFADPLVAGIYSAAPEGTPAEQALAYLAKGQLEQARAVLDDALKAKPNDAVALAISTRLDLARGDLPAAQRHADQAIGADRNDPQANLAKGLALEAGGDEDRAGAYYKVAALAPASQAEALLLLGNASMRKQQYAAAVEQYRNLLKVQPEDANALAHLVAASAQNGQCAAALDLARAAHQARPRDGLAAQLYVRSAASCAATPLTDKQQALTIAKGLYNQRPTPDHAEAYAMALAANGRPKDAVDYQAQAIFEAVKLKDTQAVAQGREFLKRFEQGQTVDRPWPPGHPFLAPPRINAAPIAATSAK